jgi:hypothetical protein
MSCQASPLTLICRAMTELMILCKNNPRLEVIAADQLHALLDKYRSPIGMATVSAPQGQTATPPSPAELPPPASPRAAPP